MSEQLIWSDSYDPQRELGKLIFDKALEFRKHCLESDLKEQYIEIDIGRLYGMDFKIKFHFDY